MYSSIEFWRFALGLAVASAPAFLMDQMGEPGWSYSYAALILLMLTFQNEEGLKKFLAFIQGELSRKA